MRVTNMNGVIGSALTFALHLAISGWALAVAQELAGTVAIEGDRPRIGAELELRDRERRLASISPNEQGHFKVGLQEDIAGAKGALWLVPRNETALGTDESVFLLGSAPVEIPSPEPVVLRLKSYSIKTVHVTVLDGEGKPVRGAKVQCEAAISPAADGDGPIWRQCYRTSTDDVGGCSLRVVDVAWGEYRLTILAHDQAGDLVSGTMSVLGKDVSGDAFRGITWNVARQKLSAIVKTCWDPDYSKDPFRPKNPLGDMWRNTVTLKGKPDSKTLFGEDGTLRFYGLEPGSYTLALSENRAPLYVLSEKTQPLTVPAGASAPVQHTLYLLPTEVRTVAGAILREGTRTPVEGILVRSAVGTAHTNVDGRFAIEVLSNCDDALQVSHQDYRHFVYPIPPKIAATDLSLTIMPLPVASGVVTCLKDKKPVPYCSVFLNGSQGRRGQCDAQGRFSLVAAPGKYRLCIYAYADGQGVPGAQGHNRTKVLLYDEDFEMPSDGVTQGLEVPSIGCVSVTPTVSQELDGTRKPGGVCLLKPDSRRIVASSRLNKDGSAELFAAEGVYAIMVISEDEKAQAPCGTVSVEGNAPGRTEVVVKAWEALELGSDGRIK